MDFTDWRITSDKRPTDTETAAVTRYYGKKFEDYIGEQIREAQARGEFDNLRGTGKPLNLDDNLYAGDKAMGYNLLKIDGFEFDASTDVRCCEVDAGFSRGMSPFQIIGGSSTYSSEVP